MSLAQKKSVEHKLNNIEQKHIQFFMNFLILFFCYHWLSCWNQNKGNEKNKKLNDPNCCPSLNGSVGEQFQACVYQWNHHSPNNRIVIYSRKLGLILIKL